MFVDFCKTCQYRKKVYGTDEYLCTETKEYKDGVLYINECCKEKCPCQLKGD